jgi:hypothetical protein
MLIGVCLALEAHGSADVCIDSSFFDGVVSLSRDIVMETSHDMVVIQHILHDLPRLFQSIYDKLYFLLQILSLANFDFSQLAFQHRLHTLRVLSYFIL